MIVPVLHGSFPRGNHSKSHPCVVIAIDWLIVSITWHNKLICTGPERLFTRWCFSAHHGNGKLHCW